MSDELKELLERVEAIEQQLDLVVDFLELLQSNERKAATEERKMLNDHLKKTQITDKPMGDA
jgi:hypothetical protein